jgi:hypothetical protein
MFFLIENYKEIENNLCVPLMRQDKADWWKTKGKKLLINDLDSVTISKTEFQVLRTLDLDGIVDYIKSGNVKNIITMAGAGISTCIK